MKMLAKVVVGLMLVAIAASAGVISNGSFESDVISPNPWVSYSASDQGLTGWTVTGVSVDLVIRSAYSAQEGDQSVDLAGTPGPGGVMQIFATDPGQYYLIDFWVSSNGGAISQSLQVFWNGVLTATFDSPDMNTWDEHSLILNASALQSTIEFSTQIDTNQGPLLDNVSVSTVPEPYTFGLVGVVLVALSQCRRLRRR